MMIPLDIVDNILRFLQLDHDSLISCLKAHPLFSDFVKRYFFMHIGLTNFRPSSQPSNSFCHTKLYNILSTEPHIANYIRTLWIELRAPEDNETSAEVYRETSLILASLPLLHKIVLYPNTKKPLILWKDLDEFFNIALRKCLQLPTLKKITVAISPFPLDILDCFHPLDELSLLCDVEPSFGDQPLIDTLRLKNYKTTLVQLYWTLLGCKIRSLVFIPSHGAYDFITLEQMPCKTLKELTLDLSSAYITHFNISNRTFTYPTNPYYPLGTSMGFALAELPNLERLTVYILITLHKMQNHCYCSYSLPTVLQVLQTLTCPPLQHLTLQITIKLAESFSTNQVNWSPLADLASLHFRSPVQLSVSVIGASTAVVNLDDIAHTLNEDAHLSALIKPGLLSIDVVSSHPNPLRMFF